MILRIRCTTTVDITATGVKNQFYKSRMPFRDSTDRLIDSDLAWHQARAQQSNWETINQIISLRTLTENITIPTICQDSWQFEFDIVDSAAVASNTDPVALLKQDCDGVPVMVTVGNGSVSVFQPESEPNIWFDVITELS
jgi:hypothetical protein